MDNLHGRGAVSHTVAFMRSATGRLAILAASSALGLAALAALAGCAPDPPPLPSTAAPSAAPVFASEEEALAAAEEAYAAYLQASDASWRNEGVTRQDFLALSEGEAHAEDLAAGAFFEERGWTKVGTTEFDSMRLQSFGQGDDDAWRIRVYVCLDVSRSDVVDTSGHSVAQPDRALRTPLEVEFVAAKPENLLISESSVWSGSNFC